MEAIIEALNELTEDNTVPKNVKARLAETIITLRKDNSAISVSKILQALEEISEDTNVQSYTRTQIFNVVSMLESV